LPSALDDNDDGVTGESVGGVIVARFCCFVAAFFFVVNRLGGKAEGFFPGNLGLNFRFVDGFGLRGVVGGCVVGVKGVMGEVPLDVEVVVDC
jgi:hypothetical protein